MINATRAFNKRLIYGTIEKAAMVLNQTEKTKENVTSVINISTKEI